MIELRFTAELLELPLARIMEDMAETEPSKAFWQLIRFHAWIGERADGANFLRGYTVSLLLDVFPEEPNTDYSDLITALHDNALIVEQEGGLCIVPLCEYPDHFLGLDTE